MTGHGFAGRTAVVTGAASGIGAAVTARLLAAGAQVTAVDRDEDGLRTLAETTGTGAGRLRTAVADVTDDGQIGGAIAAAAAAYGRLDAGFLVAGGARNAPLAEMTPADWEFTIATSMTSVFLGTRHLAAAMDGTGGAIVTVASLNARIPMPTGAAYATAKAGVEMFTRNAALELAPVGIRVNAVLPGLIDTPLVTALTGDPARRRAFTDRIPLGTVGAADQVAGPCLYLASDDAAYITGASLLVDGGWSTAGYPDLRTV